MKVSGKCKKHCKERRCIWQKLNLAVDASKDEVICADLSLNNVTDAEAFPGLIRQTHRKGAGYWAGEYTDCNRAVANQRLTGSNARWKWTMDYKPAVNSGNGDVQGKTTVGWFTDAA